MSIGQGGIYLRAAVFLRLLQSATGESSFRFLGSVFRSSNEETLATSIFLVQFEFDGAACGRTYDLLLKFMNPDGQTLREDHYMSFAPQMIANEGYGLAGADLQLIGCKLDRHGIYVGEVWFEQELIAAVRLPVLD